MTVRFSDILGNETKDPGDTLSSGKTPDGSNAAGTSPPGADEVLSDSGRADRYGEAVKSAYQALLERALEVREMVRKNRDISPSPILSILHDIVNRGLIGELYEYAMSIPPDRDLPSHIICVTIASLKVGEGMGYNIKELLRLGLTAFLENVGMYRIPVHILMKKGKLTPDELAVIRNHPRVSAEILSRMGNAFLWLAETALHTHERWDGSGYPRGLSGDQIPEAASIIGLIDMYMAMIRDRPYREKFIQTDAVKSIVGIEKGKFPPRVVKEFLNQISLFPVNTYVKLNNASIGRVLSTDKNQPMRPTVELLYDGRGEKLPKPVVIDLAASPLLHIVGTVDEKDMG